MPDVGDASRSRTKPERDDVRCRVTIAIDGHVVGSVIWDPNAGLMRSKKERETRPPKPLEDECYGSACEQQWWEIQHDGAN